LGGLIAGVLAVGVVAVPLGVLARRSQRAEPEVAVQVVHADAEVAEVDAGVVSDAAPAMPHTWRVADLDGEPDVELKDGAIGKRTVLAALGQAGLASKEAMRWLRAFEGLRKFDRAGPKDTFVFARRGKDVLAFEYLTSPAEIWQARANDGGEIVAKKLDLVVAHERVAKAIVVEGDLRGAVTGAGLHPEIVLALDDALEARADLHDLRPGTRVRVVATEEDVEGRFSRYNELLAVEVLQPGRAALRVYAFGDKAVHFYDAKGQQPYRGAWRSPIPGARISSRFNPHRMHPVLHVVMPHNGVDFGAPSGTPVYAAAAGTLRTVGDGGPCGNMVQIEHGGNIISSYCHLSRFAAGVHAGDHVEPRQLVGYVGKTGRATGPHLHFAVKRGDIFIDPLTMKLDGVRVVPTKERAAFDEAKEEMDDALDAIALPDAPVLDPDAGGESSEEIDNEEPL
jgi:murein DD-endopeptidase MepM/ murein hydrolase activator NlpD